jgi:hypothetical protein
MEEKERNISTMQEVEVKIQNVGPLSLLLCFPSWRNTCGHV